MERILITVAALALACSSVDERDGCAASADCPVGQYCAHTGDGSVCWGDGAAPVVSDVSASCAGGCRRDSVLRVTATVTEATSDVLDAQVALDLPGGAAVPMVRSGGQWQADVELRRFPFDHFERSVVATVTARDGARNVSAAVAAAPVGVTRLRWSRAIDSSAVVSPTAPAVKDDGTVVIGGSNGKLYLIGASGDDAAVPLVVGSGQITAAPAIGEFAIWVGSEDFNLYAVEFNGSAVKDGVGVNLGGPVKGSLAVLAGETSESVFGVTRKVSDNTGWIGVGTAGGGYDVMSAPDGFTQGPVIGVDADIHAVSATVTNDATLRTFRLSFSPFGLTSSWTTTIGKTPTAPLSIDGGGAVVAAADAAPPTLNRTTPGPISAAQVIGEMNAFAADSAVVLANGDVIVGDQSGTLYRFGSAGPVWSPPPSLGTAALGPLVLAGTTAPLIVPTNAGRVFALGADGQTRWEGALPSAVGLRAANLHTPAGQTDPVMSHAYLASGNGRLYSVVVDGRLDASAPWPKAFHDPRNTNRAGPQP